MNVYGREKVRSPALCTRYGTRCSSFPSVDVLGGWVTCNVLMDEVMYVRKFKQASRYAADRFHEEL